LLSGEEAALGEASATARGLYERLIRDLPVAANPPAAGETAADGAAAPRMVSAAPVPLGAESALEKLRGGNAEAAAAELASVVSRSPEDLVARYHLARAYQAARKHDESVSELRRVIADGSSIPRTLKGWALMRIGEEADSGGNRTEAETWFRRAADLKGFIFAKAAEDRLKHPADPAPTEG
jgi:predicted Zn-dependent protease